MEYPLGANRAFRGLQAHQRSGIQKPELRRPCTMRVLKSVQHGTGGGFFLRRCLLLARRGLHAGGCAPAVNSADFFSPSERHPPQEKTGLLATDYDNGYSPAVSEIQ